MSNMPNKSNQGQDPYDRLAPFIQEYIYRAKWTELRAIQIQTSNAVFDTPDHILITSGTASGKTEAAFLPVITELYNAPSTTIGVVYVGPLKALLNDQFQRLQALLQESNIPVQSWHGDIESSPKRHFLTQAQGILQITPESLEAMLLQPAEELTRLFSDLRFVIIDEVHAFIASDRGRQVICQLQRLGRFQKTPARRIGLSATLGDPQQAMFWLAGGTDCPVTLINDTVNRRDILLGLEQYPVLPRDFEKRLKQAQAIEDAARTAQTVLAAQLAKPSARHPEGTDGESALLSATPELPTQLSQSQDKQAQTVQALEQIAADAEAFFHELYEMTRREIKTLVFANSRGEVELVVNKLRELAAQNKQPDIYFTHHGSISKPMRESAESALREPETPACVVATITLELGIDLGQLDQVLQIKAPSTVASFVQRLGRSGRRGNASKMFFYCCQRIPGADGALDKQIPWDLLQAIATVQLYLEEKWIEPSRSPKYPCSLLYHQTMSILAAHTELVPPQLAEQVLTLAPFAHVTQDQFRTLLKHLIAIRHIEQAENGGLIVGLDGEKIVNRFQFYATFKDESAYQVQHGTEEIGNIQIAPTRGKLFTLAGRTWKVLEVNQAKHLILAEPAQGQAAPQWRGGGTPVHQRVLERMRQIATEDTQYPYLHAGAVVSLAEFRKLASQHNLAHTQIVALDEAHTRYLILPWQSTHTVETIIRVLELHEINVIETGLPFYFEIIVPDFTVEAVQRELGRIAANPPTLENLIAKIDRKALETDKYDEFVPDVLLREEFMADRLDLAGAVTSLKKIATQIVPGSDSVDKSDLTLRDTNV